jgi:hypothetical protein
LATPQEDFSGEARIVTVRGTQKVVLPKIMGLATKLLSSTIRDEKLVLCSTGEAPQSASDSFRIGRPDSVSLCSSK